MYVAEKTGLSSAFLETQKTGFAAMWLYLMASLTFRKEDTDSKTEGYSGDGIQYEEDKQHGGTGTANHSPLISVNTEEQQHDEHCDE